MRRLYGWFRAHLRRIMFYNHEPEIYLVRREDEQTESEQGEGQKRA